MDVRERTSDVIDASDYYIEAAKADGVAEAQRKVAEIPVGNPGDCDLCGNYFSRLVKGACGFCRDRYGL